jgi:ribokinase
MSGQAFDVIVCGSLHLDIMVYAPHMPRVDETVVGSRWDRRCGGKGGNQAAMAARAGARVAMVGRVGADEFGASLLANLEAAAVDARGVVVDPAAGSGMSAAIVRDDGDYGAVIVSGANLGLDAAGVQTQWSALGGARVLVLQNEIAAVANSMAAQIARASGASVLLNAAPARPMSPELLENVDVVIVNRLEAEMLTGLSVTSRSEAVAVARKLRQTFRAVIVTLGAEGVVVEAEAGDPTWIAPRPVKVVSTHGAGDCFVGTLAARLAQRESLLAAATAANEAAAAHVAGSKRGYSRP